MSLCGKCKVEGNVSFHTCSVDDETYYCVWCIWVKLATLNLIPREVGVDILIPFHEINWDGIYATEIIAMRQSTHWERIKNANLNYPIVVMACNDQLEVLDGCHRLAKIYMTKQKIATCVQVTPEQIADCKV